MQTGKGKSMPTIAVEDKVTIGKKTGHLALYPYVSRVAEVINAHQFLIYAPIVNGDMVIPPENSDFIFMFYTENGLYQAGGRVLEHCLQNKVTLLKVQVTEFEHTQRRNFYRVNLIMPLSFTRMNDAGREQTDEEQPVYSGISRNISGSGLYFTSDIPLAVGEQLLCTFSFEGQSLSVEGEVLSAEPYDNIRDTYGIRLRFVNLDDRRQDEIVRYIFKIERGVIFRKKLDAEIKKNG